MIEIKRYITKFHEDIKCEADLNDAFLYERTETIHIPIHSILYVSSPKRCKIEKGFYGTLENDGLYFNIKLIDGTVLYVSHSYYDTIKNL